MFVRSRRAAFTVSSSVESRIKLLYIVSVLLVLTVLTRLFFLQIVQHSFYAALAQDRHSFERQLRPQRGRIYLRDLRKKDELYPLAINQELFTIFADPTVVSKPQTVAKIIAKKLDLSEAEVLGKLLAKNSRYVVLKKQVQQGVVEQLKLEELPGIGFESETFRFYPESSLAATVVGFYGFGSHGEPKGNYGLEGYFEEGLAGKPGFLAAESTARGAWISLAPRQFHPAQDGYDLVLTIDRTLEFFVCDKLREGLKEFEAEGAVAVVIEPQTGAVLAMCDEPSFDPNNYAKIEDIGLFNNDAIFTPYEPGSVFKAITMAASIDAGRVSPETTYIDKGAVYYDGFIIRNASGKVYGEQSMVDVLKESINTGAVFAAEKLGRHLFKKYVGNFGFGSPTGIDLKSEAVGNINSLDKKGNIFLATASYGQGLTATPLQLAMAFSVFANQGKLMKPYIVSEIQRPDGSVIKTQPTEIRQVISLRTAKLISSMLAVVVRDGHAKQAQAGGYVLAGKTGTAQIPDFTKGGYSEDTEQTFVGYGPIDDPRFVMLIKFSKPQRRFAESTAAPVFGEIAEFMLKYLEVPDK